MNTLTLILLIITGITALILITALLTRKTYHIQREIRIDAPQQKVFDYIKHLRNQDHFNKWVMVEPDMKREFKGTDGTVGFIYRWSGKKAGEGEQEIRTLVDGKTMETEIRFIRPFAAVAHANMSLEPLSDMQTRVSWSNASTMVYPMNVMISVMEKMLAKDMDTSLLNLKNILEKQ